MARGYAAFEPYYAKPSGCSTSMENGAKTRSSPGRAAPIRTPPVSHEPPIADLSRDLRGIGLHPFHLPLGILLEEKEGKATPTSPCIRCSYFDGFPCPMNGKADAQVICIDPTLAQLTRTSRSSRALTHRSSAPMRRDAP